MSPRVLFTASTRSHIINFHLPYLAEFHRLGWAVHVGCGGGGALPETDCVIELPFEKSLSAASNFRAMHLLRKAMEKNRYDLICAHTSLAAFFTRLAAGGVSPSPPVVAVAHGYLFREEPSGLRENILLMAEKLAARQTNLLLTMNREDFRSAAKHRLCRRIVEIPGMGVDFSRQAKVDLAEVRRLRASLQRTESDFLLLCAAEFSSRKNQAMLLRALRRLPSRFRLLLPGEGALLERCRNLAGDLGVLDRTVFPGHVNDMPLWYAAADAAVSASRSEGLPFGLMEAMYAGLPVVASEIKGHSDLIENGRSGLLYPLDDIECFIEHVLRLTDEPSLADRLGEAAKSAMAPYALEQVLPQVMELYLSAAGERKKCETADFAKALSERG